MKRLPGTAGGGLSSQQSWQSEDPKKAKLRDREGQAVRQKNLPERRRSRAKW